MKRTILFALIFTLALSATAQAAAAMKGFYVGGRAAFTEVYVGDIKWRDGAKSDGDFFSFGIGPVAGYDFAAKGGPSVRVEGEILVRTGDDWKKSTSTSYSKFELDYVVTFLVNGWYDIVSIPVGGVTLKPFVGGSAGFGLASYEQKYSGNGIYYDEDDVAGAFHIGPGGGVRVDINDHFAADALVRYLFSSKYDFDDDKYDAPMLDVNFGLAYKF